MNHSTKELSHDILHTSPLLSRFCRLFIPNRRRTLTTHLEHLQREASITSFLNGRPTPAPCDICNDRLPPGIPQPIPPAQATRHLHRPSARKIEGLPAQAVQMRSGPESMDMQAPSAISTYPYHEDFHFLSHTARHSAHEDRERQSSLEVECSSISLSPNATTAPLQQDVEARLEETLAQDSGPATPPMCCLPPLILDGGDEEREYDHVGDAPPPSGPAATTASFLRALDALEKDAGGGETAEERCYECTTSRWRRQDEADVVRDCFAEMVAMVKEAWVDAEVSREILVREKRDMMVGLEGLMRRINEEDEEGDLRGS